MPSNQKKPTNTIKGLNLEDSSQVHEFFDPMVMLDSEDMFELRGNPIADEFNLYFSSEPNKKDIEELERLGNIPDCLPITSQEEKQLIWKFRHHLNKKPDMLTKFLLAVDWGN